MPNNIEDYYNLIHQPWGRMFYDILWQQLSVAETPKLKILDFGSGFGITANHFAKTHDVIAIEPNTAMTDKQISDHIYQQIIGGCEKLSNFPAETFDMVLCHNVLEYTENKEEIFAGFARLIKTNGVLSIVKHNLSGRVMAAAVFDDSPGKALTLIAHQRTCDERKEFGTQTLYDDETLFSWARNQHLDTKSIFGIRSFFALSHNNDVKFTLEWYCKMLELELKVSDMQEYKNIAFFRHLIFTKRG